MSRDSTEPPERLIAGEATEFERRVLDSALEKRPSAAASARMARALGVTVTTLGTAATAKALAANAASKAPSAVAATTAASTAWPWLSVGVVGLVVVGAVVGLRAHHAAGPAPGSPAPATVSAAPTPPDQGPAGLVQPNAGIPTLTGDLDRPAHRGHTTTASKDLRDEIAVLDAARGALLSGDGRGTLEVLRRYEAKYATGSFRPEATAIKIEAFLKLGREGEARDLARRFVAEQRGTLLAKRVAELVGLTDSERGR